MKVEIQTKVLASALKRLSKVIPTGATSMPVLSNVLIRTHQNGTLDLIGSNNEVTMNLTISAEQVMEPGALLVSFSYLNGLMAKIKSPKIVMQTDPAASLLRISAGKNSHFEVSYLAENKYPNVLTKVEAKTSSYVFSDDLILRTPSSRTRRPVRCFSA